MSGNTRKAIKRHLLTGAECFKIGKRTYYANYERETVIYYFGANPQVFYFNEL